MEWTVDVKVTMKEHDHINANTKTVRQCRDLWLCSAPYEHVTQDELDSMMKIIKLKARMNINISRLEISNVSSRGVCDGNFVNIIGRKLFVKTLNLWETPRIYVYSHRSHWARHLGWKQRL